MALGGESQRRKSWLIDEEEEEDDDDDDRSSAEERGELSPSSPSKLSSTHPLGTALWM